MKIKKFIKDHKTELVISGMCGLVVFSFLLGRGSVENVTQFTNANNILKFRPNLDYDTVDLFKSTKDGWNHIWAIDYGDAQILSAELIEAMSELHPA